MEGRIGMKFTLVESEALSVDTERDLEKVRIMINNNILKNGKRLD